MTDAAPRTPVIGMIVPPAAGLVPPEAEGLFPQGLRFRARGLGLPALTLEDFAGAIDRTAQLARQLREEDGADVVCLMGTSLSFFRGPAFNEELVAIMQEAAGVPATTMSSAIRDALRAVGAQRLAIGTAYDDPVNAKLRAFLEYNGFEVLSLEGLGLTGMAEIMAITPGDVHALGLRAAQQAGGRADALLISCGGLPATDLAPPLEAATGLPVVASASAGVWAAARLAGHPAHTPQLGRLGSVPLDTAA